MTMKEGLQRPPRVSAIVMIAREKPGRSRTIEKHIDHVVTGVPTVFPQYGQQT